MASNRSPEALLQLATQYNAEIQQEKVLTKFEFTDSTEYPVEALGKILGEAAEAIAQQVQAAPEIAAHAVLSVAAFAAQDKANVHIDGRTLPLSLFLLTVAESGERKSACDKVASAPLLSWQKRARLTYNEDLERFTQDIEVYTAEHRTLLSSKNMPLEEKRQAIGELDKPEAPMEPVAICQEPSLEGLQKSFMSGRPSQALFNDEGGQFFGGHAMNKDNALKTISGLSKYWDGSPIIRTRAAAGESAELFDRRLTVHLQVQPIVAQSVLGDQLLAGQGFLARFLVAEARSQAGTRLYNAQNPLEDSSVIRFHQTIERLLNHEPETLPGGGLSLPEILLTPSAKSIWVEIYDQVELALAAGEMLEIIKAVASKAGENTLRIAGVFAVIEGSQEITKDQVERAWRLEFYYLNSALRSAQLDEVSERDRAAVEIRDWLQKQPDKRANIADIQKKGPRKSGVRKSASRARTIMQGLVERGWIAVISYNTIEKPSAWKCLP